MKSLIALAAAAGLLLSAAAHAEIKYLQDPVYQKLASEDPHPMDDLVDLSEGGDPRAQFILGDLYSKGKGGLSRNEKKARQWFAESATNGYSQSFIRLAAIEKRAKDPVEAYKWYTLGIESLSGGDRKWASGAREALVKDHKMTRDQTAAGRKAAAAWKKERIAQARAAEQPAQSAEDKKPAPQAINNNKKPVPQKAVNQEKTRETLKKERSYND